jgi:hypothetical protein
LSEEKEGKGSKIKRPSTRPGPFTPRPIAWLKFFTPSSKILVLDPLLAVKKKRRPDVDRRFRRAPS